MQNILFCFCNLRNPLENHGIKSDYSYNFACSLKMVRVCVWLARKFGFGAFGLDLNNATI